MVSLGREIKENMSSYQSFEDERDAWPIVCDTHIDYIL